MWNSFVKVPLAILHMSTGIPEAQLATLTSMPLVVAPGTGGEACLKKCGLNFTTVGRRCGGLRNLPPLSLCPGAL